MSVCVAGTHILAAADQTRQKNWATRSDRPRGPHSSNQSSRQASSLARRERNLTSLALRMWLCWLKKKRGDAARLPSWV